MSDNIIDLLLADDSEAARKGLRALLKPVSDVRLVGEASGGQEAITLAEQLQPDIILMDLHMPDINGMEVAVADPDHIAWPANLVPQHGLLG